MVCRQHTEAREQMPDRTAIVSCADCVWWREGEPVGLCVGLENLPPYWQWDDDYEPPPAALDVVGGYPCFLRTRKNFWCAHGTRAHHTQTPPSGQTGP